MGLLVGRGCTSQRSPCFLTRVRRLMHKEAATAWAKFVTSARNPRASPLGQMKGDPMTAQKEKATTCINIVERFGDRFQIELDESYYGQYGESARKVDPWYQQIRCRYGSIYPFGGSTLAASVDGAPIIANRLRELSCCRVHQDGDFGELTVTFDVSDFATVAKLMKPKRRRRLTEEQRRAAAARLAKYSFKPAGQSDAEERKRAQGIQRENLTVQPPEGAGAS